MKAPPPADWTHPPIRLTPHTLKQALEFAVHVPFDQVPGDLKSWYTDAQNQPVGDVSRSETIHGYFYLEDQPGEINHPQQGSLMVRVQNDIYAPLGQHSDSDKMDFAEMAAEGRLYLISEADFTALSLHYVPGVYLLSTLGRTREDPYTRFSQGQAGVKKAADTSAAMLRAARRTKAAA